MFEHKQMPITLEISGSLMDLQVLGFIGKDALNELFRFDIDLISTNPHLDMQTLAGKLAWLELGAEHAGIHGLIHGGRQLYAGTCLSLYRITLVPRLLQLEQSRKRRVFKDLSVPQLITHLLTRQGLDDSCYRFEPLVGLYPPRELCVQYDETDLHLLQRLCEEEGIHFRFEHSRNGDLLIFADDPVCFPERQAPIRFQLADAMHDRPGIGYLSEHLTLHIGSKPGDVRPVSPTPTDQAAHHRQINARTLERLRCERRHIHGVSRHCALISGQIMQVLDHPVSLFNDQWLLVKVHHRGRQPHILEGCDPHDIAAILNAAMVPTGSDDTNGIAQSWTPSAVEPFEDGHRADFCVLPWAMTYRPSRNHRKPCIRGSQHATLMCDAAEHFSKGAPACLPIRYDWQKPDNAAHEENGWPLADLAGLTPVSIQDLVKGSRLVVRHFDNDPDRPVICGVEQVELAEGENYSIRMNGAYAQSPQADRHISAFDNLSVACKHPLMIHAANATVLVDCAAITVNGPKKLNIEVSPATDTPRSEPSKGLFREEDLRLTEDPGLAGPALANCIWYIVFMLKPGLDQLARLEPQHFLFEGKTDEQGYLGLSPGQINELAARYRNSPDHLYLVYPGCCMKLQEYFARNWSAQRLRAFMQPD
ncbi:MAG TPA: contractile injection system protein, VgrG/Pvc8 family [Pseudomonas sp.]